VEIIQHGIHPFFESITEAGKNCGRSDMEIPEKVGKVGEKCQKSIGHISFWTTQLRD
jgi:hypothetical protein